jgi:hypothetical protein
VLNNFIFATFRPTKRPLSSKKLSKRQKTNTIIKKSNLIKISNYQEFHLSICWTRSEKVKLGSYDRHLDPRKACRSKNISKTFWLIFSWVDFLSLFLEVSLLVMLILCMSPIIGFDRSTYIMGSKVNNSYFLHFLKD